MPHASDASRLAHEIQARLASLPVANTPALRRVRREFSRQIAGARPEVVVEAALLLLHSGAPDFVPYELILHHKPAFASLGPRNLAQLGATMNGWSSVDSFATILAGPAWCDGKISDNRVQAWARSNSVWCRRAALVSTVARSRRGTAADVRSTLAICSLFVAEREDLLVKALSWALRELSKKHSVKVLAFLARHRTTLAPRVLREVESKLTTGRKNPPRSRPSSNT
jgi:hypothetical protein